MTKPSEMDSSGFVLLSDIVPDIIQEIRYYSTYNFIGERIDGYDQPCALLTKEAALVLKEASDEIRKQGFCFKVFDAYRPQRAVDHFITWSKDLADIRMKQYFYPNVHKSELFNLGYLVARSGHSRGSTLDLTLFDMAKEKKADMGSTFDYFGEESNPNYRGNLTEEQIYNRNFLREVMIKHGFQPLPTEWWHFTLIDEPYPDTYFNFSVAEASLSKTI